MSQHEIIEKVGRFLNSKLPFTHESDIVYLLVETRKHLEHTGDKTYPTLTFVSNWIVHTNRSRSLAYIKPHFETFYKDLKNAIENKSSLPPLPVSFTDLRDEQNLFLKNYGLSNALTRNDKYWESFLELLILILTDQPIIKPCDSIASFHFDGVQNKEVYFSLKLEFPINGLNDYSFKTPF